MPDFLRRLLFLPVPGTEAARGIDRLHLFVITTTFAGALAVAALVAVLAVRYRARRDAAPTPVVVATRGLEFGVGGGILFLFIAWWVLGFRQYVGLRMPPKDALEVYVTAKQWMWNFTRPDGSRTVGVLVVPRGVAMRLLLTSRDVVHSFYVPAFRIKQDAVPGRYTSLWFEADRDGTYPVYCAEYCGTDHSRMWARIVVLSPNEYARWADGGTPDAVRGAGAPPDVERGDVRTVTLAEDGRRLASRYGCFSCHTTDGQRHVGPTWSGLYGATRLLEGGRRVVADEDYLTRSMMEPRADLVVGFAPVMPVYQGVLEQADVAAILEFVKSLRAASDTRVVTLPEVQATGDAGAPHVTRRAAGNGEAKP